MLQKYVKSFLYFPNPFLKPGIALLNGFLYTKLQSIINYQVRRSVRCFAQ